MPAQIGINPVIGKGAQQDDERQDGDQQRGPEKDDRIGEVEGGEMSGEELGWRPFEPAADSDREGSRPRAR